MQKSKIAQMVRGQVFKRGKRQSSDRFGEKVARDLSTQSQITATQALNFQPHTRKFVFQTVFKKRKKTQILPWNTSLIYGIK